jgi:DNA-binding GntR family transcriptional regulator
MELPTTKSELAYGRIRKQILSGALGPGEVINQAELAVTIGISTTPLREALRRLKTEGLVALEPHRDARVSDLSAEEARDLIEIRSTLDPLAAALAAERRGAADIRAIRAAVDGLEILRPNPSYEDLLAHRRFHAAVYRASHNELLVNTLDGLWDKADRYRRFGLEAERGEEERRRKAEEHRLIVECVAAGDAERAAEVMRDHIGTSLVAKAAVRLSTRVPFR